MHEIRMQHPGKNALGNELLGWLESEIDRAGDAPILLTGAADAFSAGLNLKEVAELDARGMEALLRRIDACFRRLYLHPAPTVAYVNGHAIAGGCILAVMCDWRVAVDSPKARIGINEVAIGACIPPLALRVLRHRLSPAALERVVLGAQLFAPADAAAAGLVDEVHAEAEPLARQRLTTLAAHPRGAYAVMKRALRAPVVRADAADERRFVEEEIPLWTSPEMKARVLAVLNRK